MLQQTFEFNVLAWPALSIFFLVYFTSFVALKRADAAFFIAVLKAGLYIFYFGWLFDGKFTYLDDLTYIQRSLYLLCL